MAAVELSENSIKALKRALRRYNFDVREAHMSEAIASSLGYNTYAALLADERSQANDPPIKLVDIKKFTDRLRELGYPNPSEISLDDITSTAFRKTVNKRHDFGYNGQRQKTWRNLLVTAINEGLRQKLFSLRPGDNRWPGGEKKGGAAIYEYELPNNSPVKVRVENAGFDELDFTVAVFPTSGFNQQSLMIGGFELGEAVVTGTLERMEGAFIWWGPHDFRISCRKALLPYLSGLDVQPDGYGDRG